MSHTVVLVGPMGAGKSSVGRRLASLLGYEFADTDAEVERRTGVDIPYVFEREGEAGFRERERQALESLIDRRATVLATGGGIVTQAPCRAVLSQHLPVVYLHATVDQQYERVRYGKQRPLLQETDPRAVLTALFEQRAPWYLEVADLIVHTDGQKVERVAHQIVDKLDDAYGQD
ncbi:MAG: shikimate kinase [Pseudomonadota bacterium]